MTKPLKVLLLEDSETDALLMLRALQKGGYQVSSERVYTENDMREALSRPWDIILSDHNMHGFNSLTALTVLKESGLDIPLIIISGAIGEEVAVQAMKAGASDYLMKDKLTRLVPAIERELKEAEGRGIKRQAQADLLKATQELESSNRLLKLYTEKLEKSNRELEQFATIVSHDLQAPLRKISTFIDMMNKERANLTSRQSDFMERIKKASLRMQDLIRDLLELSRVNRSELKAKHLKLGTLAESVVDDLMVEIQTVKGKVEIGEMMSIEAEPLQIRQLLQNLIQNALKFNHPGRPPLVKVSSVPVEENFCCLTVSDNGIGFRQEHENLIFQVFQRLPGSEEYTGSGMGLAIVAKIVERHGGTIEVESQPDEGSTFRILLPVHQSSPLPERIS